MLSWRLSSRTFHLYRIRPLASSTIKPTSLHVARFTVARCVSVASISKDHNSLLVKWDKQKDAWSRYHYEWLRDNCACPSCRHPGTAALLVKWDKQKDAWSRYHYEWLRDNCACPSCRHPGTGQRILTTLEDSRPDIIQGDIINQLVKITWKDGHNSQFQHSWLLKNSYYHNNIATIKPAVTTDMVLWDAEYFKNREPPSVGYEEFMKSDGGLLKMLQQFKKYGLCFIHNTPASKEATSDAIRRIGRLKNSYYGGVWNIIAGSMSISNIAYDYGIIPVHTDHATFEEPVGLMAFHCIEYKGEGGETMLLDGFKIAEYIRQYRPDYFTILSQVAIPYQQNYEDGIYEDRKMVFSVNHEGEVTDVHLNHEDRLPFDIKAVDEIHTASGCDKSEAVSKFYEALRYLHNILYDSQFVYEMTLSPGNVLAFNNRRLLHGRKEFNGYRNLCGVDIGREEWESTLKLLERK